MLESRLQDRVPGYVLEKHGFVGLRPQSLGSTWIIWGRVDYWCTCTAIQAGSLPVQMIEAIEKARRVTDVGSRASSRDTRLRFEHSRALGRYSISMAPLVCPSRSVISGTLMRGVDSRTIFLELEEQRLLYLRPVSLLLESLRLKRNFDG